ncbi:hypothetical protein DERP_014851 [Dermatophagoides pteronyssinus]|uniref:Uncharacterized protein n=1 Tax=Dermatophagoides pteronyssinus TaxID=6956 RepID=A0ABQ8JAS8_DERPT|nr:hypothetical protein DERP_014851 [Dermatophagoides pteronyssinus]
MDNNNNNINVPANLKSDKNGNLLCCIIVNLEAILTNQTYISRKVAHLCVFQDHYVNISEKYK